jgi:hypothetical protein
MRAIAQYADCPSCDRPHYLCLPTADPIARQYGYTCPATGLPVTIDSWGPWQVTRVRPAGALDLSPLRSAE